MKRWQYGEKLCKRGGIESQTEIDKLKMKETQEGTESETQSEE